MESKITIEVDFENGNQPIIQIIQKNSDDVRDKLIQSFAQNFGGSSWCQIKWQPIADVGRPEKQFNRIHITPIRPDQLEEQAKIMLEQAKINEQHRKGEIAGNTAQ